MESMKILCETITQVKIGFYEVRIWRASNEGDHVAPPSITAAIEETILWFDHSSPLPNSFTLAKRILQWPEVNAVQVTYMGTMQGQGVVLYKDWP